MRVTGTSIAAAMAGFFAMSLGSAALAQNAEPSRAANLYVGLAVGQSDGAQLCNGLAGCDKRDNTFGAFAGYWLHPSFSLELGYHNLGKITVPGGTSIRSNVWEFVAVGYWHATAPLSLYGKFGPYRGAQSPGGIYGSEKNLVNALTYGFGAQYDVSRSVGLRAELQAYPSIGSGPILPAGDINVARVSALWRFR